MKEHEIASVSTNELIDSLIEEAKSYMSSKDERALTLAEEALEIATTTQNKVKIVLSLFQIASYYYKIEGAHDKVLELFRKNALVVEQCNLPYIKARMLNMQGICYDISGMYSEARAAYLKAINMLENIPDLDKDCKSLLGNLNYNVVKLFSQLGVPDENYEYLEKALSLFKEVEDNSGIGRCYNFYGSALPSDAPIEERMKYFALAIEALEIEDEDAMNMASARMNYGFGKCHLGEFDEGIAMMKSVAEKVKGQGQAAQYGFYLFQLGEAHLMKGDFESALKFLDEAEELMLETKSKVYLTVVYSVKSAVYEQIGNLKEALHYMKKHHEETQQQLTFDRKAAVQEARLRFELEHAEKEFELLKKKNEEIEVYNQKLKQSNDELNQFAYVASHDLKEPLRMITNYTKLLERSFETPLTEDQQHYMHYIREGGHRMFSLIDSILQFSKIGAEERLRSVDLKDVLKLTIETVKEQYPNIKVTIDAPDMPIVGADEERMTQLFQNLMTNGIKYNKNEERYIKVTSKNLGAYHLMRIEDNGIGIAEAHREKVFELFKRLHNRNEFSGTGIGLAICKKIIKQLHGSIWIEDSSLGGTAFCFTLPAL